MYIVFFSRISINGTINFIQQDPAMAIPVKWTLCLLLLLPFQTVADEFEVTCGADEANSCSKCYAALVKHVLTDDMNQFNIQNTFFPPDKASPAFVTISYEYYKDNETSPTATTIWFWSTSTFYIYHPLPVFQFSSLLFSDINKQTSELTLKLDLACMDARTEFMRLLTQRVSAKQNSFPLTMCENLYTDNKPEP